MILPALTAPIHCTVSPQKPRETGNTQTGGAQVHESLLTAPKTNTIPLATRGESNQHKYSPPANGDELAGDNTAELARKDRGGGVKEGRLWEHLPRSPNDSCSESDSWASEDGRVPAGKSGSRQTGSSHGRKKRKAYENKHRTKPYYRDAQTGKQFVPGAGRDGPAAARKLVDDKLRSNFDQAYSIDVLTRLQRLEELQHWNTVETFEKVSSIAIVWCTLTSHALYSGAPLMWTLWGPGKVWKGVLISGVKLQHIWDAAKRP